ncbi:methylated-DNA--[protein]-cysteine S-methyltransferase [Thermodesulfobacteriota bacterium]
MAREKIQEIYCWKIESDELNIYLASSKKGAVRIGLSLKNGPDCIEYFKKKFIQGSLVKDDLMNRPLMNALKAALKGRPISKNLILDISSTPFQRMVWEKIDLIPFGQTRTYGEVAVIIGRPGGARAVGQAMNKNPLPLIFP